MDSGLFLSNQRTWTFFAGNPRKGSSAHVDETSSPVSTNQVNLALGGCCRIHGPYRGGPSSATIMKHEPHVDETFSHISMNQVDLALGGCCRSHGPYRGGPSSATSLKRVFSPALTLGRVQTMTTIARYQSLLT